jgi:two-component system nitrate/nitrite response regulator NarL
MAKQMMPQVHNLIVKVPPFPMGARADCGSIERMGSGKMAWPQLHRVIIVDPLPLFRDGLARLAETMSPGVRVDQYGGVGDLLTLNPADRTPELFLIDLCLPLMEFAFTFPRLRRAFPRAAIVAMAADFDEAAVALAMRSGCDGFIHKALPSERCSQAIGHVLSGAFVIECDGPPKQTSALINDQDIALTRRQKTVLNLLAKGASNKAIARELGISHLTVRLHVSGLFRLFGVTRRKDVAPKARIMGLLPVA